MITKKQKREMAVFIRNEGVESFCEYNKVYIDSVKDAELTALVKRFDAIKKKMLVHIDYEQSLKEHDRIQEKNALQKAPDPAAVDPDDVPCCPPVDHDFEDLL